MPYWNFRTILDLDPENDRTCVGKTSKGVSCRNPVGVVPREKASRMLDKMDQSKSFKASMNYLEPLAQLLLCKEVHNSHHSRSHHVHKLCDEWAVIINGKYQIIRRQREAVRAARARNSSLDMLDSAKPILAELEDEMQYNNSFKTTKNGTTPRQNSYLRAVEGLDNPFVATPTWTKSRDTLLNSQRQGETKAGISDIPAPLNPKVRNSMPKLSPRRPRKSELHKSKYLAWMPVPEPTKKPPLSPSKPVKVTRHTSGLTYEHGSGGKSESKTESKIEGTSPGIGELLTSSVFGQRTERRRSDYSASIYSERFPLSPIGTQAVQTPRRPSLSRLVTSSSYDLGDLPFKVFDFEKDSSRFLGASDSWKVEPGSPFELELTPAHTKSTDSPNNRLSPTSDTIRIHLDINTNHEPDIFPSNPRLSDLIRFYTGPDQDLLPYMTPSPTTTSFSKDVTLQCEPLLNTAPISTAPTVVQAAHTPFRKQSNQSNQSTQSDQSSTTNTSSSSSNSSQTSKSSQSSLPTTTNPTPHPRSSTQSQRSPRSQSTSPQSYHSPHSSPSHSQSPSTSPTSHTTPSPSSQRTYRRINDNYTTDLQIWERITATEKPLPSLPWEPLSRSVYMLKSISIPPPPSNHTTTYLPLPTSHSKHPSGSGKWLEVSHTLATRQKSMPNLQIVSDKHRESGRLGSVASDLGEGGVKREVGFGLRWKISTDGVRSPDGFVSDDEDEREKKRFGVVRRWGVAFKRKSGICRKSV